MLSSETFGRFLIDAMPYSAWIKTFAFLVVWLLLALQGSSTRLGRWLNRFFLATFLTSVSVAILTGYVAGLDTNGPNNKYEWAIAGAMNILPFVVGICGLFVAYYARKVEDDCIDCLDEKGNRVS